MKKQHPEKEKLPKGFNNFRSWQLSRKLFMQSVIMGGVFSQLPWIKTYGSWYQKASLLSEKQLFIVSSVQEILFPSDENGPGAIEINATEYLLWILSDKNKDPEEIEYIINGIGWVDETANENYSKKYLDLEQSEKEQLISDISNERWGESWLSVILSFIFEALLCDPQYGGNPDKIGWEWLGHYPGQPKPTEDLLYPEILTTIHKS